VRFVCDTRLEVLRHAATNVEQNGQAYGDALGAELLHRAPGDVV
jgi:hypothetical protein